MLLLWTSNRDEGEQRSVNGRKRVSVRAHACGCVRTCATKDEKSEIKRKIDRLISVNNDMK